MTPKDRFINAMELKEPDKVPIFIYGISGVLIEKILGRAAYCRNPPVYFEACSKGKWREANEKVAQDLIDLSNKFDLDAIRDQNQLASWFVNPKWEYIPEGVEVKKISEKEWKVDNKKVLYSPEINSIFVPEPYLPDDIDKARDFLKAHWKDVEIPEDEIIALKKIRKACEDRFIISVVQGTFIPFYSPFDKLMLLMRLDPNLYKMWSDYYLRININRAKLKIEAGADAILITEDYAFKTGPFLSLAQFREFVWPNLKNLCYEIKKEGAFCIKHTDGNINSIIGEMVEQGIDGLHSLEKDAGINIAEVKERYGNKICLLGNLDQARKFTYKNTSDEVIKEVKECIDSASPGGGHVLTTSNNFTPEVKIEHITTWIDFSRKYGIYPLVIRES
ncbi:MAG: uroporphyrinogen decarboxylase family protein [Nitrososphaerales archaeon]